MAGGTGNGGVGGTGNGGAVGGRIASVVIPAHDEEAVIGRLLDALGGDDAIEVVVACNGCSDRTATMARDHGARVVELDTPSKIAALDAGDAVATAFPRFYVDADIVLTRRAVESVASALAGSQVLCAAPPLAVDDRGRPWPVRAYVAVWQRTPYLQADHVGSGVYAMSAAGRARFDRFPDVIADDLFARNLFARSERAVVPTEPFLIQAPWTLGALVRRRIRIDAGNRQLAALAGLPPQPGAGERVAPWWRAIVDHPRLATSAVIYAGVNLVATAVARRRSRRDRSIGWGRDTTTRERASHPAGTG